MITRSSCAIGLMCLMSGLSLAADDPFCGKWKLNAEKSKLAGRQIKMEDLGNNKLRFTNGDETDTIVVNGTDQPLQRGGTMALTKMGPNAMRMVVKMNGKVASSMVHTLSDDGKTQTIEGTSTRPNGSNEDFKVVTKRVGGGSGWTGTWESTNLKFSSPDEWEISPYGDSGLTFYEPARKATLNMNFDGKDYAETGPWVAAGSTSSGKRIDQHSLQITDKFKGKPEGETRFEVSPDGKTLTLRDRRHGQPNPLTIVYDKL